jgi:leucyl-tRNA synthetase
MNKYNPKEIEPKWQQFWNEQQTYAAETGSDKEKFFGLIEFPYPSGAGLHVGHPRPFTAMDVITRKKRMEGYNVLFPIGFDAFGLPTENYAIKTGRPPAEVTAENIANFTRQLQSLGYGFDWARVVDTTDPDYYKWTQWIFQELFKHGLAYKTNIPINWCLSCKIGLANEEIVNGKCERCGGDVEKRDKEQWMLAITEYADQLLDGLDDVDYIPQAQTQQTNWIGRSTGASVNFKVSDADHIIEVFTTRPDTLFGATYMVVAPEHNIIEKFADRIENIDEVRAYIQQAKLKSDLERAELQKEKTGVELKGLTAVNPVNQETLPIFVADYVLATYGTGAIMAVPAHDERDYEFAQTYNLPIKDVVAPHIVLGGDCTPLEAKETTSKDVVSAIIRDPKTNQYLLLQWGDLYGFVGGSIEDGEGFEVAVKREVIEETGYTNFEIVDVVIPNLFGHGYKARKDVNCFDLDKIYLIDILDTNERVNHEGETDEHNIHWVDADQVATFKLLDHHRFIWEWHKNDQKVFAEEGIAVNSDFLNSLSTAEAKEKILNWLEEQNLGARQVNFKLRDWVFSRQRYWGEPIPLVYCEHCAQNGEPQSKGEERNPGWIPVATEQLPVTLPAVERYEPTDTGESPLAAMTDWVKATCPRCGNEARRETDTMPNWAGSSWYFLRYIDPHNDAAFASVEALDYWGQVDWYNGGMEHTVLHLLYSRFWNQFLHNAGHVPFKEPYKKRTSHGMILAKGGEKMSKSKGNVVNPDDMVERFGADTLRTYIMFMGPFAQAVEWDTNGLVGVRRFLDRVWNLAEKVSDEHEITPALETMYHQTIKKVTSGIDEMNFNTAVAKMMEFVNEAGKSTGLTTEMYLGFVKALAPFAPHMAEELWQQFGNTDSIALISWPTFDETKCVEASVTIGIQVNGKVRDTITVARDAAKDEIEAMALASEKVQKYLAGNTPKKVIVVPQKIVNIVV